MEKSQDDNLAARLKEARAALEGEEWQKKQAAKETELIKRRHEAMMAMEGSSHRQKREKRELFRQEQEKGRQAREEAAGAEQTAEKARVETQTVAAKKQQEEEAAAFQERVTTIEESEKIVSELARETDVGLSPVRTLKTDMAKAVKSEGLSAVRIAMAEQAKRAGRILAKTSRGTGKVIALIFLIIILIAAAGGGFLYFTQPELVKTWLTIFFPAENQELPTGLVPLGRPLIFSESFGTVLVNANDSREMLLQKIAAANQTKLPAKTIRYIYFTDGERLLPFSYLRQALALNLPGDLNRALKDDFMLGSYNNQTDEKRPFLILTNNFFERAFSGLLQWEKTLAADLALLLDNAAATATPGQSFMDKVLKNKDCRVLQDAAGKTIILYGFLDNTHTVITTAEDAFEEILQRFIASE